MKRRLGECVDAHCSQSKPTVPRGAEMSSELLVAGTRHVPELKTLYRVAAYRKEMNEGHHHCRPMWNLKAIIALG